MSVPNCYIKVKEYLETKSKGKKVKVDTSDLRDMAVQLSERRAETLSPAEFAKLADELYVARLKRDAMANRAAKIMQLQKTEMAKAVIAQDVPNMNVVEKLEGWMMGNARKMGEALNRSVHDMKKAMTSKWLKDVRNVLTRDLNVAESGLLTKEITQELAAIESGAKLGASGSEQAVRIAKAYNSVLSSIFETKKAFDPFLGKIQDYYFRGSHDRAKITEMGKEAWVPFAMSKFGKKSFPEMDLKQKTEAFGMVFDDIRRGTYGSTLDPNASSGDIMRKMAKRRTLIPNDWQSFHDYNQAVGQNNVHLSVIRAIESASHDISVIQKFGANPRETVDGVINHIYKSGTPEDVDAIKAAKRRLDDAFLVATQVSHSPINSNKAKFMRGAMSIMQLTKNSGAFLRSWQDMANFATMITDSTGGTYLGNFVGAASEYMKMFASSAEARSGAASDLYLFSRSALHNMNQELTGSPVATSAAGKAESGLNKLLELQSWASMMDRHISAMDAAMANVLSRRLGQMTELSFGQLDPQAKQAFKRYGIGELEWDVLKQGTEDWSSAHGTEPGMGRMDRMLTAEGISSIPDEIITDYLRKSKKWPGKGRPSQAAILRARTELETSLGALVSQHADSASSTAGAAEALTMYGNTDVNSWQGMSLRMLLQFKSATVKNYDTMMRSYYSNPNKPRGDWTKIGRHAVLSSGLWAMGEAANQLSSGKTPEDPLTPEFAAKALFHSGATGIFGETLASEVSRADTSFETVAGLAKSLSGPTLGTAYDIIGIGNQAVRSVGDEGPKFPSRDLARFVTSNIPYQNLFWSKAVMNYYFANEIREWLAPGMVADMEQRTIDNGQEYLFLKPQ